MCCCLISHFKIYSYIYHWSKYWMELLFITYATMLGNGWDCILYVAIERIYRPLSNVFWMESTEPILLLTQCKCPNPFDYSGWTINWIVLFFFQIHMKTMPAAMYRLLTAQEQPVYIWSWLFQRAWRMFLLISGGVLLGCILMFAAAYLLLFSYLWSFRWVSDGIFGCTFLQLVLCN